MEVERKYLITHIPFSLEDYSYEIIYQGYISVNPVIRIRQKGNNYYLTCKSKGLLAREEFEIEITKIEYNNLINKVDYNIIHKKRYYIKLDKGLTCELDLFDGKLNGLIIAEVEFTSIDDSYIFNPPSWFGVDVTEDAKYQNSNLCRLENAIELLKA